MHEWMCRNPGGLGGGWGGQEEEGEWTALGDRQDEAPVSRWAGGSSPGVEPPQVEEELGRTCPHLEVGRRVCKGQRRAGLAKRATSSSLCSACIMCSLPGSLEEGPA